MAIQPPYGNGPGDIEQAKKKLQGRMPSLAQPGDPARAARMQAQFEQPVTGPRGAVKQAVQPSIDMPASPLERVADGAKSAYEVAKPLLNPAVTAVDLLTAAPADYLRNATIRAAGGDPTTAEGGETANRDRAYGRVKPAIDMATSIGRAVRDGASGAVLSATGAQPAVATPALKPQAPGRPVAAPRATTGRPGAATPQAEGNGYAQTGIAGVAARRGANGVPEFTNEQAAVGGASRAMAAGIGGIGNGKGTFSQGQAGDSQLALDRFERANQERAKMVEINRRGGIGEFGGLTIVKDSSRGGPGEQARSQRFMERQDQAKRQGRIDQVAAEQAATQADRAGIQFESEQQQRELGLASGKLALDGDVRMNNIRALLADPTVTGEQRETLERAYRNLSTPGDKRFITVAGGTNEFGGKDASKVFDTLSQDFVGGSSGGQLEADLQQARAIVARDPSKQQEIERRLKLAYGRGLEG